MFAQAGAGKKKSLTDPVDIIPFPKQSLREKAAPTQRTQAPEAKPLTSYEKPEPKILSAPTGQLSAATISIKKHMEPSVEGEKEHRPENLPYDIYSYDQVKRLWRSFAFIMKERGMETFYNALIRREPFEVEADVYRLVVENQVQIDYITPHLQEMNAYFRKELKNYAFTVSVQLTDNPDEEIKYLTGKDKFQAMARRNPNLHTLKNMFNLDIEP